jgi:RNA polymerase sigma-70 factor (ECF subfamily)
MYLTESGAAPDQAVIADARAGSADAFRVLVERHSRSVFRLAFRMTGNQHDAEDLVQETFLRACKQLHRYDGRASFATWLYRIASNCSVDLLRARKSRERRIVDVAANPRESAGDPLEHFASASPSPETLSMGRDITRLLSPAMRQLSERERTAFVMRHYEGLTIEEISHALNIRQNAAKNSIFRAVQKLRRVLEPSFRPATSQALPRTTS